MEQFGPLIAAVIPIYLLLVVGGVLRRAQVLRPEMDTGLMRLVIHVLYPALILDKILRADLLRDPGVVFSAIGLGFGIVIVGYAVATLVALILGMHKGTGRRSFTITAGLQNYGYVAIPLLITLFPLHETAVLGLLFTHSLGVELAVWTVGMMILRGAPMRSFKAFLSGPIVAVVVGLVLLFARVDVAAEKVPAAGFVYEVLLGLLHWLGLCAFPMGLMLIGTVIADVLGKDRFSLKVGLGGVVVRMGVMPIVILAIAKFLPLVPEFKMVLLVQAAMPSAVSPIVYARHYGGNPGAATQVVLATSAIAIITIPLIIGFGRAWLGV